MDEMKLINISELKKNKQFSQMVPEMTRTEYEDFLESIKKVGIRQPIHILKDKTILDGRHRVRACKDLNITEIQALVHSFDEDEAIEFVRDTAIERRNINKEQRIDIILRSEELINELEEKAKKRRLKNLKKEEPTNGTTGPARQNQRTDDTLGEMAGVSGRTFRRMKRVKRESPELYEDIVKGEKSIRKAHDELPSVKKAQPKEEPKYKIEELTEEEARSKIAYDNLVLNFNQLNHYVASNQENLYEAICKKYKDDEEFMDQSEKTMKNILELMEVYKEENKK